MSDLRLGDVIDDYCVKCRRLTNHSIVSMLNGEVAKVRCRSCYHDHDYLKEQIPPSKKELKKAELLNAVLGKAAGEEGDVLETPEAAAEPVEAMVEAAVEAAVAAEPGPVEPEAPEPASAPKKKSRAKKA